MVYKILIVDDEKMMTELLSDHLRDCDYETIPDSLNACGPDAESLETC